MPSESAAETATLNHDEERNKGDKLKVNNWQGGETNVIGFMHFLSGGEGMRKGAQREALDGRHRFETPSIYLVVLKQQGVIGFKSKINNLYTSTVVDNAT